MLRAASVGVGWWSNELATAVQGRSDKIRIVSCYSRSEKKRREFAATFETDQHPSYEALLADTQIDAVVLTTPHSLHADHVAQAAHAGKHVFVEKPFTLTVETGIFAAAACADAGRVLAVGHNRRFSAAAQALRKLWEEGFFGTVLHLEANFSAPGAMRYTPDKWRANRIESPAGAMAGLGIHMVDLLCWLAGPVQGVCAQSKRRAVSVDMDDTTSAIMEFTGGATGYLGTLFACPYTTFVNIYGTDANASADIDGDELTVQPVGEKAMPQPLTPVDTLRSELEEFADACSGGTAFRVRPEEAIHSVAVMEAIVQSAMSNSAMVTPKT